ncbi:MAG: hypothetical protein WBE71_13870 [Xanthobacteraceae bacterium]
MLAESHQRLADKIWVDHPTGIPSASLFGKAALSEIAIANLGVRIIELGRGESLTLIGIGCAGIGDTLRSAPADVRSALLVQSASRRTTEEILRDLLDDSYSERLKCRAQPQ